MQRRAQWTHEGGTWSLPGGALREGEDALAAALREAHEEAGIEAGQVHPQHLMVSDHVDWSYTTVVARASAGMAPRVANAESESIEWVPIDEVPHLPLHSAFSEEWPRLAGLLSDPVVIVDGANVVGSRPDGWWKDRPGAAARLIEDLRARPWRDGNALGFASKAVRPEFHVVLEGKARAGHPAGGDGSLVVHHAPGEGDDAIVAVAEALTNAGRPGVVVTSDRGLRARLSSISACVGASALARPGGHVR